MEGSEGIKSAAAETVRVNELVSVSLSLSVTVTVTVCVPVVVGVPDRVRFDNVNHPGFPLTVYDRGVLPPVAALKIKRKYRANRCRLIRNSRQRRHQIGSTDNDH